MTKSTAVQDRIGNVIGSFDAGLVLVEEDVREQARVQPEYHQLRLAGPLEGKIIRRTKDMWRFIADLLTNVAEHNATVKDDKSRIEVPTIGENEMTVDLVHQQYEALLKELHTNGLFASFNTKYRDNEGGVAVVKEMTDSVDGHPRLVGTRATVWNGDPKARYNAANNPNGLRSIRIVASGPQFRGGRKFDGGLSNWLAKMATDDLREGRGLPPAPERAAGGGQQQQGRPQGQQPAKAETKSATSPVAFGDD